MSMSPQQKALVQESFDQLFPLSEMAAELFYSRLFYLDPSLRALFKVDFQYQSRKFMDMMKVLVADLERSEELAPTLRDLGARHAGYGVQSLNYETVGTALLWAIEKSLGRAYTPELRVAWSEFYALISEAMRQGATATESDSSRID